MDVERGTPARRPVERSGPGLWLRPLSPRSPAGSGGPAGPAGIRLICMPYAGGAAGVYRPFAAAFGPDVEVVAVQYPGRQDRWSEPPPAGVTVLADRIADALRAQDDHRPLALFGHSMGATVAYEVGRRLERLGAPAPTHLFASARRAPSRYRDDPVHLHDDAFLLDELERTGGLDPGVRADPDLLELVLPTIRGDYTAIESYRHPPGPVLRCPITVLLGADDPLATPDEARSWTAHSDGGVEFITFPGGHFYLTDRWEQIATIVERRCRHEPPQPRPGGAAPAR